MALTKLALGATVGCLVAAIFFSLSISLKKFAHAEMRTTPEGKVLKDCLVGSLGVYHS